MRQSLNNLNILVTGASGFIGLALIKKLNALGFSRVIACSRNKIELQNLKNVTFFCCDQEIEYQDWTSVLKNVDVVIHLAARVHMMNEALDDPLAEYRRVNLLGTMNLAVQSSQAGVKRFIYLSTVKVHGEKTESGASFDTDSALQPTDPYAISKAEAELGLLSMAEKSNMNLTIIRPPLVYGPGAKGNIQNLLKILRWCPLLPFSLLVKNRRSYVGLDNLVHLIIVCISHPAAANNSFLVSDGKDMSTVELIYGLAKAARLPVFLFPLPQWLLRALAATLGKKDIFRRIGDSLQVDITKTMSLLGWVPSVGVEEGFLRVVESSRRDGDE